MNVFNYILKQNTFFLFFLALVLSIALRGVFLLEDQYSYNYRYLFLALILFVGAFNALVMIIVFIRIVQFIFSVIFKIIDPIEGWAKQNVFNQQNYDLINKTVKNNEPKVKKTLKEMNIKKNQNNIFWVAPIVAMLLGLLPMPFGFFILLKLIVSAGALYFAVNFHKQGDNFKVWIFGFIVVLYNPIIPIPLGSKVLWIIVNIPTIYYFYINRKLLNSNDRSNF